MKNLVNKLLSIIELFDKKFEHTKLRPAWGTISTFFFSGSEVNPSYGPHIRANTDLKRYMLTVMVAVAPVVLASIYFFGWRCLALVIVSYIVGIIIEMTWAVVKNEEVTEGMFVTCILYPMILPPTIPFWIAIVGIAFGIIIGKEVFGGTGKNIFNPAIVGRVFIAAAFPVPMSSVWITPYHDGLGGLLHWTTPPDAVTSSTPLIGFKNGMLSNLMDMFIGTTSGCIGETSALIILLCGVFLVITRVANWRLPLATIVSALIAALLMHSADSARFASPLYHLLGGGLLFAAFFMVTDPVTCPFTSGGKWIYGAGIGIVTILIRNLSGYPEGVMFAILIMNMFAPIIDDGLLALKMRKADIL